MAEWQKFDIDDPNPNLVGSKRYWVYAQNQIYIDRWCANFSWYIDDVTHYKEIDPHELPQPPRDL